MPRSKKQPVVGPPHFKVQYNGLLDFSTEIEELFNAIVVDYCRRFDVQIKPNRKDITVMFSMIVVEEGNMDGLCVAGTEAKNRLLIQVRCPTLEAFEPNRYVVATAVEVICHEMVHACQYLTGRPGMDVGITANKDDSAESYFFDHEEIEARVLEKFYAHSGVSGTYCKKIMDKIGQIIVEENDDDNSISKLESKES